MSKKQKIDYSAFTVTEGAKSSSKDKIDYSKFNVIDEPTSDVEVNDASIAQDQNKTHEVTPPEGGSDVEDSDASSWEKVANTISNTWGQLKSARWDNAQALNIPLSYGDKGISWIAKKMGIDEDKTNFIRNKWAQSTAITPYDLGILKSIAPPGMGETLKGIELMFLDKDERAEAFKDRTFPQIQEHIANKAEDAAGEVKETGSILKGIKEGSPKEIAAGVVDGVMGFVPSLVVGMSSGGIGFIPWVVGGELNRSVQEEFKLTDKGIAELFEKNEANVGTSLFVGVTTGALEKYGFSKLTKYLKTKEISRSFAQRFKTLATETGRQGVINWVEAGLGKYSEAYTQLDAETENKNITSKTKNGYEAAKEAANFLVSEEGLEAGVKAMAGSFVMGAGKNMGRSFSPKENAKLQKVEIGENKESAMIESEDGSMVLKDKTDKDTAEASKKYLEKKYPNSEFEVVAVVDKEGDFVEGKFTVEQKPAIIETETETPESKGKLTESDKKAATDEQIIPKIETESPETEPVNKIEKAENPQKKEPRTDGGEQKRKEVEESREAAIKGKEVTSKNKEDGKQRNGDELAEKEVQKQQIQKQTKESKTEKSAEDIKGIEKDSKGSEEKSKTVSKKSEIVNGKISAKKNFVDEIQDRREKLAVEGKVRRIVSAKQKAMDKDISESKKKKDKELDKEVHVDIFDEASRTTKNYRVKKKADGSFVISSLTEVDSKGRPKPLIRAEDSGKIAGIRKKIIKAYKEKRDSEQQKLRDEIELKYHEETEAEITQETKKYLEESRAKAREANPDMQKEKSGEFPKTPTVSEGGKAQRLKLPSEEKRTEDKNKRKALTEEIAGIKQKIKEYAGKRENATERKYLKEKLKEKQSELRNVEKDTVDVAVAFKSQIRIWTRRAREQKKFTEDEFSEVSKKITKKLKEAVDNGHITNGQYRTIINRIGHANTDKRRAKIYSYVDKVIEGSEYRGLLGKARLHIKNIKKGREQFGDAYKKAEKFINIDIKDLDTSELKVFNELAQRIYQNRKVPDTIYLDAAIATFGDRQKGPSNSFAQRIEKAKKDGTFKEESIKLEIEFDKYIEETQSLFNSIDSVPLYITAQKKLNHARRRLSILLSEEIIAEDQAEVYRKKLGEQDILAGKWEEVLSGFKKDYANSLLRDLSTEDARDIVNDLPIPEQRVFKELFGADKEWMEELPIRDLFSVDLVFSNLRNGHVTPEAYTLKNKLDIHRRRVSDLNVVAKNITKKKKLSWVLKKGREALRRRLAAEDKYRIDSYFKNFSKTHSIVSQYYDVTKGVQLESNLKSKLEQKREKVFDKFISGFKGEGILTVRKKANEVSRKLGNFLIERRHQSRPEFKEESINEKNASRVAMQFERVEGDATPTDSKLYKSDRAFWGEQFAEAKDNGLTKEINGIEVIDVEKYEAWLRKDKHVSALLDAVDESNEFMKSYAKASAMENGRTFIDSKNYISYIKKEKGGEVNANATFEEIQREDFAPKMQAGATYALKGSKAWLENDVFKIMQDHSEDVLRNYFVKAPVENSLRAIKEAFVERSRELKGDDGLAAEMIGETIMLDIKDAVKKYYNSGRYAVETDKWFDKWIRGATKGMLLNPARIPAEYVSNTARAAIATGFLPKEQLTMSKEEREGFASLHEQYIGDKYWSRYSPEVGGYTKRGRVSKTIADASDNFIMFSDKAIGLPLFRKTFNEQFTEITGDKFDAKRYGEDADYYYKNREAIDKSAAWGTRRVEELFNGKTALSQAQVVKFLGGTIKINRRNLISRVFNVLQSFNRNELHQMHDSMRRISSGNNEMIAMGIRDITSVIVSNAMYSVMRYYLGIAMGAVSVGAIKSIGGPDPTDYEKEKLAEIQKEYKNLDVKKLTVGLSREFTKASKSLTLGGSGNVYKWASVIAMYGIEKSDIFPERTKDIIYKEMEEVMYARKIPAFGTPEAILKATLPVPAPAVGDLFDTQEAVFDTFHAVGNLLNEGRVTEKQVWSFISLFNLGLKYSIPNVVSPSIQKTVNRKIQELQKAGVLHESSRSGMPPRPNRGGGSLSSRGSSSGKTSMPPRPNR